MAFTVPQTASANKTRPRPRLCDRLGRLHSSATGAAEPDADASYVADALAALGAHAITKAIASTLFARPPC